MAAILKSNMAAPDVNSDIAKMFLDPRHRKHRYRHLNFGPRCNRTGDNGQNYGHFGAILKINMAATRVREFLGSIFLMICMYHRTLVQSVMLSLKTARFWCLGAPLK